MTILVTGAAGFIGSAVAEALVARGDAVIGLDNLNDYYSVQLKHDRIARITASGGSFRFVEADFADARVLDTAVAGEPMDRIVHLGAQAGVRYSIDNPAAYIQSNLVGHANILELARTRSVRHLVYASSSSVYGGNETLPFSVDDRADWPVSLYAATKRADELLSESYASLYRLPQTGLRFFTVYGPWGRPDMAIWLFTDAVINGRPINVFNGGMMERDFTYIDDIVSGVMAALDRPPIDNGDAKPGGSLKPHALYNLGNNRPNTLEHLITLIEDSTGRKAVREIMPMQQGDVPKTFADITATQRHLGFAPITPLGKGIAQFVSWFREYRGV